MGRSSPCADCVMPHTSTAQPRVESTAPGQSSRWAWPTRNGGNSPQATPAISAAPTGTLTSMTQRHPIASVNSPPATTPNANPAELSAAQSDSARTRAWGSWWVAAITSVIDEVARTAAPTPCTARAASSKGAPCAHPAARLASVNSASPHCSTGRRP